MVHPDRGDDRDLAVHEVRRVPGSAQPDLEDAEPDGLVGEPQERERGDGLEVRHLTEPASVDELRGTAPGAPIPAANSASVMSCAADDNRSVTDSRCGDV